MSDYQAAARTNYFTPKNEALLVKQLADLNLSSGIELSRRGPKGMVMLYATTEGGDWPTSCTEPGSDCDNDFFGDDPFDIGDFLATHVAEGEVAVVMEVGFTGISDLVGWATAVSASGEQCSINLTDILDLAVEELGKRPRSMFA